MLCLRWFVPSYSVSCIKNIQSMDFLFPLLCILWCAQTNLVHYGLKVVFIFAHLTIEFSSLQIYLNYLKALVLRLGVSTNFHEILMAVFSAWLFPYRWSWERLNFHIIMNSVISSFSLMSWNRFAAIVLFYDHVIWVVQFICMSFL